MKRKTEKARSILTRTQRKAWAKSLARGVPEKVIAEFDKRLGAAKARWKKELQRAVRTGTPAILRDPDDDA